MIDPEHAVGPPAATDPPGDLAAALQRIDELTAARNEAHATIAQLFAELAFKNQEIEAWAYCVGHDLRVPLRAVEGFSRMFEETLGKHLDGEAGEYQRRVRRAVVRLEDRIAGLLELFKVGRSEPVVDDVSFSELARDIAIEIGGSEGGRLPEGFVIEPDIRVTADRRLLRVALVHLLGNAWKFSSRVAERRIDVGRSQSDEGTAYVVRDNGVGFDPAYSERLFEPFQRLHGEREFPGLGVGLATVDRVVRRHGGRVWATGSVGEGAEVSFTLAPRASIVRR